MGIETQAFGLAHGESVRRSVGDVRYEVGDRSGAAPVIFGRRDDASLLGMVTLARRSGSDSIRSGGGCVHYGS